MKDLFSKLFGGRAPAARRDDPFADPRIAAMNPAQLADLPLTHPMSSVASSVPAMGRRASQVACGA
ncbi:hypothetical protein SAMN06297129_0175 [Pseudooceanicola antarcticus]|uniref:Uncharacterized protein n=1 Tax=Pseudooceanicola antarcticus TaxID=1247613 RepID=A0A285HNY0_9RHOB|nr:hypothetical protein [Pseudooceanicola antarcticus]PJE27853.1 hypothetical protein CVM39_14900 [Pseudooceanicola antarcticus]SNY36476.1 hypothetical protein SAMN06297129_0175 [Pseudooceanicola antarcticus]